MIEHVDSYGQVTRTITLYEPGDIIPDGINVIPYRDRLSAQKGDYVTDLNGLMIPCRRRQTTKRGMFLVFPRFAWFPEKYPDFIYPLWRLAERGRTPGMPDSYNAVLRLVGAGEDLLTSALLVFKGVPLNVAWKKTLRMFRNDQFLEALVHQGEYMSTLRKKLIERGIDEDRIAEEIEKALGDDSEKKSGLKKWALETSMKILEQKPGRRPPEGSPRYDDEDELDRMIGTTPSPSLALPSPPAGFVEVGTSFDDVPHRQTGQTDPDADAEDEHI